MRRSAMYRSFQPLTKLRENTLQHSLILQDQSVDEIIDINRGGTTLSCLETREEYYLSGSYGEIVEHPLKITRAKATVSSRLAELPGTYSLKSQWNPAPKGIRLAAREVLPHASRRLRRKVVFQEDCDVANCAYSWGWTLLGTEY